MQNAPWQVFVGLHVMMIVLTVGALYVHGETFSGGLEGFLEASPVGGAVGDLVGAWNEISWNPLSILVAVFTFIKSIVLAIIGLVTLNYALLEADNWVGAIGLVMRAAAFISGGIYTLQVITQVRS